MIFSRVLKQKVTDQSAVGFFKGEWVVHALVLRVGKSTSVLTMG